MPKKIFFNMPLYRVTVADPGKGPGGSTPLIFGPNCGLMGKKNFLKTGPPPLSQGLDDRLPLPLSDGLDPPLCYTITNHKLVLIISPFTEANVKTLPEL